VPASAAGAEPAKAQITILYDAFGKPSAMQKDWGFAALIERGGFGFSDTGLSGGTALS